MTRTLVRGARSARRILLFTVLVLALLTPAVPCMAFTGALTGTVTDADTHLPLENVEVWTWDYDTDFLDMTSTGPTGYYSFSSLDGNGTYGVDFWKPGYVCQTADFTYSGSPVMVNAQLEPASVVASGTVTSAETGEPIADAYVSAMSSSVDGMFYAGAVTDSEGHYVLYDDYDEGADTLDFYVEAEGYIPAEWSATWNGSSILLKDFELQECRAIARGKVTDARTGEPVVDAYIGAYTGEGWEMEYIGDAYTDTDGEYLLYDTWGYGATNMTVEVYAEGYESTDIEIDWNGTDSLVRNFSLRPLYPWTGDVEVVPIEGDNRYETAVEGSRMAFPESGSCDEVVLASGENFPDALGGSALAGALDCPVLLTKPGTLSNAAAAEIRRLGAKTVWVIGGSAAVSDAVVASLKDLGVSPKRIAGSTRYATAALVAEKTIDTLGPRYSGDVMIATGENFPDALAAAPLATYAGVPILLVKPDSIPGATQAAIDSLVPTRAIVLGGDKVVGTSVYSTLKTDFGSENLVRLAGADRYATACAIAKYGVKEYGLSWGGTGFATGATFPDALAGGAAQGLTSTVMLLTKTDSVPNVVSSTIESYGSKMNELHYYGGTAAISTSVRSQITNHVKAMHLP